MTVAVHPVVVDRFDILFVCYANLCRSPLAERLARRAFDDAFGSAAAGIGIASAGTRASPGSPMHHGSAEVLAECGVDEGGFRSRPITAELLTGSDLVLTATGEQRSVCLTLAPAAMRKVFTLRQFARFSGSVPAVHGRTAPERLRTLVAQVNATRHQADPVPGDDDDLRDPVNQPIEAFRVCAEDIWRSLRAVIAVAGRG